MSDSASPPLLQLQGLTKAFPGTLANDRVDLTIQAGEIHALLGENGAGKSTLVKMIYGLLAPDAGDIRWRGSSVSINRPAEARKMGVGMVFQHFSLFESLNAAENIALSMDEAVPLDEIARRAQALSERYGLPLDPYSTVGDLSVGERQRIEIIRCLLQEPDLLILDEPTSVLTPQEADKMFVTLEQLRADGKSILYISHRLQEVLRLCDAATVLRHGRVVNHCTPAEESATSLANMMVGSEVTALERPPSPEAGEMLLRVQGLSRPASSPFAVALKDISLSVPAGHIVGIAGVAGNGQSELFEALSGEVLQARADSVMLNGREAGSLGINQRRALGVAMVPEERLGHGAVPDMALADNLLLSRHACADDKLLGPLGWLRRLNIKSITQTILEQYDVRSGHGGASAAGSLSGGNLQKFIIGRELTRQPSVLLVNQPTWGVDAGAATHIRQSMLALAQAGSAVLLISQDLDELFDVCDSIAVMHDGTLSPPIARENATLENIGLLMGGLSHTQPPAEEHACPSHS